MWWSWAMSSSQDADAADGACAVAAFAAFAAAQTKCAALCRLILPLLQRCTVGETGKTALLVGVAQNAASARGLVCDRWQLNGDIIYVSATSAFCQTYGNRQRSSTCLDCSSAPVKRLRNPKSQASLKPPGHANHPQQSVHSCHHPQMHNCKYGFGFCCAALLRCSVDDVIMQRSTRAISGGSWPATIAHQSQRQMCTLHGLCRLHSAQRRLCCWEILAIGSRTVWKNRPEPPARLSHCAIANRPVGSQKQVEMVLTNAVPHRGAPGTVYYFQTPQAEMQGTVCATGL